MAKVKAKDKNDTTQSVVKLPAPNPKRGEPGYNPDKDPLMVGFQFGGEPSDYYFKKVGKDKSKGEEIDPYDFFTNPATGKRPGEDREPNSSRIVYLDKGIPESAVLPPLRIWQQGGWLGDVIWNPKFNEEELSAFVKGKLDNLRKAWPKSGCPQEIYTWYITPGEGMPGNDYYAIFVLPDSQAKAAGTPHHPLMWPKIDKEYKWGMTKYSGYGGGGYTTATTTKTTETKKPSSPGLPAGVLMRHVCGHWFKVNDIPNHATCCPATEASGESDWAMMCDPRCGCETLDEASKCKPGYPRPKPVVAEAEKPAEAVTSDALLPGEGAEEEEVATA